MLLQQIFRFGSSAAASSFLFLLLLKNLDRLLYYGDICYFAEKASMVTMSRWWLVANAGFSNVRYHRSLRWSWGWCLSADWWEGKNFGSIKEALACAEKDQSNRIYRRGAVKILDSTSLCRSEWDENGHEGIQTNLVQEHIHMLQCCKANSVEETGRLDAERWRTKSMLEVHCEEDWER